MPRPRAVRQLAVLCAAALMLAVQPQVRAAQASAAQDERHPPAQPQAPSATHPLAATPPPTALPAPAPASARPRVALVLSGGGARGFAHIGVLRVLRELHVPVDMVVGTSMGGVVGGAYAAGAALDELNAMARNTDWDSVVADRPARNNLVFRRREEDLLLASRIEFGLRSDGVALPPSAAGNAALEQALGRLLPAGTRDLPVNHLALPFRSVASDLITGELVELEDTPLFLTMRASLAVPGVFAPVRVNGHLVVDGGLVRNLPVDMARAMGADVVIAVNVGTPLAPEAELGSALGVAQQMMNILTEQNVQRSLKELRAQDILIAPDLKGVGFLDFKNVERAIRSGELATRALAARLAPLALDDASYAVFENRRLAAPALADAPLPLAKLAVTGTRQINPQALARQSGLVLGQMVSQEQVHKAADALYGRGDLAHVEALIADDGGKRDVTLNVAEADWARSRLRIGLELNTDFNDANSFAIKLMHVKSSINPWGGELRSVLQLGDAQVLGLQWWQPLGPGSPWYVAPSLQFGAVASDLFNAGRRIERRGYGARDATFVVGRELGTWGDIQAGVRRRSLSTRVLLPEPVLPSSKDTYGTTEFLRYRIDTLDLLAFPTRGVLVSALVESAAASGSGPSLASSSLTAMSAFHTDNWAGHLYAEFARAQRGSAPVTLGGFLRLSGTATDSVEGRSVAFTRLVMARRIGALPVQLGGTVRIGMSLEAGGGFAPEQPVRGTALKQAVSGFFSVDTRFGPVYLGVGATKDGSRSGYLFLGPVW
jgi:NTE family protein